MMMMMMMMMNSVYVDGAMLADVALLLLRPLQLPRNRLNRAFADYE